MKLNRNNILLILFFIVILVFCICISSKNTLIETNENYGLVNCNSTQPKVLYVGQDPSVIANASNCLMETITFSLDETCSSSNIGKDDNHDKCSHHLYSQ
jgi:hypothetical protein